MDINGPDVIKEFISSVKEYNKQRTEAISQKLQRNLQILCSISDTTIFDPNNTDGAEFYVSLYDLMSTLDSRTGLMWYAVSVLEEASKHPSAQHILIHKYKFTPILTQLLSGHLILDKQIKVLRLLQEFTYGVKILWQDAHLPLLISILIKWIKDNDKSSELVSLSLGVLVNLCYKNLPAIYVLRRVIDVKEFIRSLFRQAKDVLDIRVQAYKMLIILEEVSGEISDDGVLSCVQWIFKRIYNALEAGNVYAMRHLVDFFKDIKENNYFKSALLKYQSYPADTEKLLRLLETKHDEIQESECIALLLDFVQSIILLEKVDMEKLFLPLIKLTLTLTGTNAKVSQMALQVICTVMAESRKNGKNTHTSIIKELDASLPILLSSLNVPECSLSDPIGSACRNSMTAVLALLLELCQEPAMSKRILSSLQPIAMKSYFLNIVSPNSSENENIFDESSTSFYLQGLSLVSSLAIMEDDWNVLFTELMQNKKIKMKLAASLYTGSPQVKCQVLQLITYLGRDNRLLTELSHCMSEIDKLVSPVSISNINGLNSPQNRPSVNSSEHCSSPFLTLAQQNRLDQCISTVQQAVSDNKFGSVGTAAVLELYEYRVAAMSHTESVLQGNLQAVDNYCTQLRHRVSIMTSEMNKLLSALHSKEESLEMSQLTVTSLRHDVATMESSLQTSKNKLAQVVHDLNAKSSAFEELCNSLNHTKSVLKDKQEENLKLLNELQDLSDKLQVKCKESDDLVSNLESKEEIIKQKSDQLKEMNLNIQNLGKKIDQQNALIKSLEKSICDKDDEIAQHQAEIAELEAMRDVIMKVTMEKEKTRGKKK